jgi:hypothetical protein
MPVRTAAILLALVLIAMTAAMASSPAPPAGLLPESAAGWRLAETASFDRTDLFSYIDGGAEVYLAYAFRRVWVGTYRAAGRPSIAVELYDMATSDDAYGVLSVDPTGERIAIGSQARYGAGLLRFCKGRWFVRALADEENPQTRAAVTTLGKQVAAAVKEQAPPPALLKLLPAAGLIPDTTTFLHTRITLNQLYYLGEGNPLRLGPETSGALASYRVGSTQVKLLLIAYPSAKAARAARDSFAEQYLKASPALKGPVLRRLADGTYAGVYVQEARLLTVLEAKSAQAVGALLSRARFVSR